MINNRSRHFGGVARAVLLSSAVFASPLVSTASAGAQESPYPESTDLTPAETSAVSPLTPGIAGQRHFESRLWVPYNDGFARVRNGDDDLVMSIELIDREGAFTTEDVALTEEIGSVLAVAINDDFVLVHEFSDFGEPAPAHLIDREQGSVTGVGSYPPGTRLPQMSYDGATFVGTFDGAPFWAQSIEEDVFRDFTENDNGTISYVLETPAIDHAGTVVAAVAQQVTDDGERYVVVLDRLSGGSSDEIIELPCDAEACEFEIGGIHVDGFFTNVYVGSFALAAGPESDRVSASYHRISSNTVASIPVAAISPNGRFLVGNNQVGDEPEPTTTKLTVFDTETGRERLVSISGLENGQIVTPLSVSDDGLLVQYEANTGCFGVCLIAPSYTGWFELEPTAPVTNGAAADQIQRLYRAVFGRIPDAGGFEFWMDRYREGQPLLDIAAEFAVSDEFVDRFGAAPTDEALIDGLYQNVLGRDGEAGGVAFWLASRADGASVAFLLVSFADSEENIARTATREPITVTEGRILRLYRAVFGRAPDDEGMAFWVGEYDGGQTLEEIAARFMDSPEFDTRFGDMPSGRSLIDALYINVLERRGDESGIDFWAGELDGGMTIPALLVAFASSDENVVNTGTVR